MLSCHQGCSGKTEHWLASPSACHCKSFCRSNPRSGFLHWLTLINAPLLVNDNLSKCTFHIHNAEIYGKSNMGCRFSFIFLLASNSLFCFVGWNTLDTQVALASHNVIFVEYGLVSDGGRRCNWRVLLFTFFLPPQDFSVNCRSFPKA